MATMADTDQVRPVVTYPRDAILDYEHMAAAFGTTVEKIKEANFPAFRDMGRNSVKFLWGQVLDDVAKRAKAVP